MSENLADEMKHFMPRRRSDDINLGQFYCQLGDGRCIAVTVQPMSNGGMVSTYQDITEQRRSEAKITHMALHDTLTGLPNRALLNEQLEKELALVKPGEVPATHVLDLDNFKTVNDSLGLRPAISFSKWWPKDCARRSETPIRSPASIIEPHPCCRPAGDRRRERWDCGRTPRWNDT